VDILNSDLSGNWDVIVSNPPYVLESEKKYMKQNVLNWEPEIALFVEDSDPLIFYRIIAEQATKVLNKNGILYFEINESFGQETIDLLDEKGFVNIELKKDINDKDRMVKAIWK
jgi:release factor glutamine methyltransferase